MYWEIGNIFAGLFFTFGIGMLFFKKGRKALENIFNDTMFGDMLIGDFDFDEDENFLFLGLIALLVALMFILYGIGVFIISLLIVVIWPLLVIVVISGYFLKKMAKRKREQNE